MARPKLDPAAPPTTDRILAAAEACFARGFAEARLADIAREAGIRRPSLLYHFSSKEALYAAVVEQSFAQLGEALARAMALEGSFAARIDALVRGYLEFLQSHPHFAPLMLREMLDGRGPGRELLLAQVVPLLDQLEAFIAAQGARDVPLRGVILQVATAALVREACGPLKQPLWGEGEPFPALARALLLQGDR